MSSLIYNQIKKESKAHSWDIKKFYYYNKEINPKYYSNKKSLKILLLWVIYIGAIVT